MNKLLPYVMAAVFCTPGIAATAADAKNASPLPKGDLRLAYAFPETGETIPYRLFVPSKWNKNTKLPLLVYLHAGDNIDFPYVRGNNALLRAAEERGYIVLTPNGYRGDANQLRYNSPYQVVPSPKRAAAPAPATPPKAPPAQDKARAEQDVLTVTDRVIHDYNADPNRVYLSSNSFGGAGVFYLAQKYPERWAAFSVSSSPIVTDGYPFERIKSVPMMVIHGEDDDTNSMDAAVNDVEVAKKSGVNAELVRVKSGTHLEAWTLVLPQMLDFFDLHQKKK
jgi:predicted peptidase